MSDTKTATRWHVDRPPGNRMVAAWSGGQYESAVRPFTPRVEGRIAPKHHLVMATLKGGAERHAFTTAAGFAFEGRDVAGTVSFLPAGCERQLLLENVCWEWGAIGIDPEQEQISLADIEPFVSADEPFLFGLVGQMHGLLTTDGALDATYCDAMSLALRHHLVRRQRPSRGDRSSKARCCLTPRQLRQTLERIDDTLHETIRIRDLANPLGLSEGYFYRAFRKASGKTPLTVINERRVNRAVGLLSEPELSITEISLEVGLSGSGQLSRLFRTFQGISPSEWRRAFVR